MDLQEKGQRIEKLIFPGALLTYQGRTGSVLLLKGNKMASPAQMVNQSIEGLEYEFAQTINRLVRTQRKQIAVLRGHQEPDLTYPSGLLNALAAHYTVQTPKLSAKTNLSGPHTVHCLGSEIIISFLGDAMGEAPGGYLHLNKDFEIVGRWENSMGDIPFGYDFWYQPRHNVMVSSEWAAPNTFMPGFDLEEVGHLKYGRRLHFWDFEKRVPVETMYLGEDGLVPLEVKFHHDPDSTHVFCGAALSANVIHFWKDDDGKWQWEKIIDVENEPHPEWPIPVPGVMSAILVSMDDKYLYLNNWLHGDMRQYDISDPHNPKLTGQVWMGGLLGRAPEVNGVKVAGGPQMFQLSLDGKRMYVTTSLFSTWDNQFYPEIRTQGGVMMMIDCDVENGGMKINEDFMVDFGKEPNGPSRCHETRYPGGDCTSDIWL